MSDVDQPDQALSAALIQISGHAERIAALDGRYQELAEALSGVAAEVAAAAAAEGDRQADVLACLDVLEQRVISLASSLAAGEANADDDDGDAGATGQCRRRGGGRSRGRNKRMRSEGCVLGSATSTSRPTGSWLHYYRRAGSSIRYA